MVANANSTSQAASPHSESYGPGVLQMVVDNVLSGSPASVNAKYVSRIIQFFLKNYSREYLLQNTFFCFGNSFDLFITVQHYGFVITANIISHIILLLDT